MRSLKAKKKQYFWLSLGWTGLLFAGAVLPAAFCKIVLRVPDAFSIAHVLAYIVLGFLLAATFRFQRHIFSLRMTGRNIAGIAFVISLIVGVATEGVQIYSVDRVPSWGDFYCDALGAFLGILSFMLFSKVVRFYLPKSMPRFAPESRE